MPSGATKPWCRLCGTSHDADGVCRGNLAATGEERHGWRVNVETPHGLEAYGVLVAEASGAWRARILTYPNILWSIPGGGGILKFIGRTPQEAERQAIEFIRRHCASRGYRMRDELVEVPVLPFDVKIAPATLAKPAGHPGPRKIRFLPVRFGVVRPTEAARTADLSEGGMFVITETPVPAGQWLNLSVDLEDHKVELKGVVRWSSKDPCAGRAPGMGIQIEAPPPGYLNYVRQLP
jgi:hypothetical protein